MFRLPNAIFRGLHYPYISYSIVWSVIVCLGGIQRNIPVFQVGVGYCSLGVAICYGI
jgi:hypothetical protein